MQLEQRGKELAAIGDETSWFPSGRASVPTRTHCFFGTLPPPVGSDSNLQRSRRRPRWPATSSSARSK